MNYTDFLVQKLENKTARELAKEYQFGKLLTKSKNMGERLVGLNYLSAIDIILKVKDLMFARGFHTYKGVWNEQK